MSERSQAVCMLVQNKYLWDAEIILRSFYECGARIWFLGFQTNERREVLAREFLTELDYSHNRKSAQKAALANFLLDKYHTRDEARIFEALQNEAVFEHGTANKATRKSIEARWSFYEILDSLGRSNEVSIVEIKSLLHIYGMMSHLIHADQKAIDLAIDELSRPEDEIILLRAVHFKRIMSDLVSIWTFSLASFRYANMRTPSITKDIQENFDFSMSIGNPISVAFHDSQRSFYDRIL